jgi:multicomponent Na+:H+ antiporter subunit D
VSADTLGPLLALPVVLPLTGAAAAPLLARLSARLSMAVSILLLAGSAGVLLAAAPYVFGGHVLVHYFGGWGPVDGHVLGVTFGADSWGLAFALVTAVVGAILLLFMLSEQGDLGPRELGWFSCLFQLLLAGLIGGALTADMVNLFVWFEVAALASYALTAFFLERPLALEAAFKMLVLTNVASFVVFMAAALLYADRGALNMGQLQQALAGRPGIVELAALGLLLVGFATKAGLVPCHGWLPDAHSAAPGPVSALFSGLMVNFGIVAIGRLVYSVYAEAGRAALTLLLVAGLISAVGGAFFALFQDDLKRLLAYDTIAQMGVLAVGLATATASGLAGTTYHLINHALFKALLFLCAGAIVHATGATKLSEMTGLGRRMRWLGVAFGAGAVAIAGIPPLNGYVSVGLIHEGLIESHQFGALAAMVLAQVLTVAALGRAAWRLCARPSGTIERTERLRPGMLVALVALGVGCLAFGVLEPWLTAHVMTPSASALLDHAGYARAALSGGGPIAGRSVSFDYFNPAELLATFGTVVAAIPVLRFAQRHPDARFITRVRAVQSGSVNDYVAYQAAGLVLAVVALIVTQ